VRLGGHVLRDRVRILAVVKSEALRYQF
jgi:hypothetical protein